MKIKLSSIEPKLMAGADMVAFQQSQGGDPCYIDRENQLSLTLTTSTS